MGMLICPGERWQLLAGNDAGTPLFRIRAIDSQTGRGVPMVRFTVDSAAIDYYTDSAGVIAFDEAGLMGEDVYFLVEGFGYDVPVNEHGEQALVIPVKAGGETVVRLKRRLPGQRLYRITGLSPYRDSRLLGDTHPVSRPRLKSRVVGQDSVYIEPYRGKLFWLWGDTFIPLSWQFDAHHEVTAATGPLPVTGDFDPEFGVEFDYFTDDRGFPRKMVAAEDGGTMTWFDGLVSLADNTGREHLFALYVQMRRLPLDDSVPSEEVNHSAGMWWADNHRADTIAIERLRERGEAAVREYRDRMAAARQRYTKVTRGLMKFDDDDGHFHIVTEFPIHEVDELHIGSQPLRVRIGSTDYIYFCGLYPNRRVTADVRSILNIADYESFTCLRPGSRFDNSAEQLDRDADGSLRWAWKRDTSPVGPNEQAQLVKSGHIKPEERWIVFRDIESDQPIVTQHNTIKWNPYRNRYVGIFSDESTKMTDAWYAEADSPMGPWVYMQQVVTLGGYTFYNPCHFFDKDNGQTIFVEGTVTTWLGDRDQPAIPRYNYNQMMYKVDLSDARLFLPVPVFELNGTHCYVTKTHLPPDHQGPLVPVFFAPDRPRNGTVAVYRHMAGRTTRLSTQQRNNGRLAFYAEPAAAAEHSPWTVPLYEYQHTTDGTRRYSVKPHLGPHFDRSPDPICYVWENPSVANSWDPVNR